MKSKELSLESMENIKRAGCLERSSEEKMNTQPKFTATRFPWERQMIIEGGRIASKRHTVFGLIEVDVTEARRILREYKARTGESLSFTAFIVTCLGKAV